MVWNISKRTGSGSFTATFDRFLECNADCNVRCDLVNCSNAHVIAEGVGAAQVLCGGGTGCQHFDIAVGEWTGFKLQCTEWRSCFDIAINAEFAGNVEIESIGDFAADRIALLASHAQSVEVVAEGVAAFTNSSVDGGNASWLAVWCGSLSVDGRTCYDTQIRLSSLGQSNYVECQYGACSLSLTLCRDKVSESVDVP